MKRIVLIACAVIGLCLGSGQRASASWSQLGYSGYQPWWNLFAKRYKCLTPEEERLQKFWHDYYDALKNYYCALDHIDWVAYYKNRGYWNQRRLRRLRRRPHQLRSGGRHPRHQLGHARQLHGRTLHAAGWPDGRHGSAVWPDGHARLRRLRKLMTDWRAGA